MHDNISTAAEASEPITLAEDHQPPERASGGFIKLLRDGDAIELIRTSPSAFLLLTLIALRARRTNAFNKYNLEVGQALVGDHKACGLSAREYRTAKHQLAKWQFATFQPTSKGTVARFMNTSVFDINMRLGDEHDDRQPTSDRQLTKNGITGKKETT